MSLSATLMEHKSITQEQLQTEVVELLGWSLDDLSQFIYDTGLNYLKTYFGKDQEAIRLLEARKEFWTWFKNHWTYRDQAFVETFLLDSLTPLSLRLEMYKALHDSEILACEIYPNRQVLGSSFSIIQIHASC